MLCDQIRSNPICVLPVERHDFVAKCKYPLKKNYFVKYKLVKLHDTPTEH
jgi:hypothetical protein